jgi:MFS family permease
VNRKWDVRYEIKAVALLIAFGLVGPDRLIVSPLPPLSMRDFGNDYRDLGNMSAALALTSGISAIVLGRLSDRIGRLDSRGERNLSSGRIRRPACLPQSQPAPWSSIEESAKS